MATLFTNTIPVPPPVRTRLTAEDLELRVRARRVVPASHSVEEWRANTAVFDPSYLDGLTKAIVSYVVRFTFGYGPGTEGDALSRDEKVHLSAPRVLRHLADVLETEYGP